jgi:hypothetical protein
MERAVVDKKPVPEIDFTLHTMEDGTQVSTQQRVCKGTSIRRSRMSKLTLLQMYKLLRCNLRQTNNFGHQERTELSPTSLS